MTTVCRNLLLAVVSSWLLSSLVATPVNFDIPAQSAATALQLFNKQSKESVLFPSDQLKSIDANPVRGEFEPKVALDRLLDGTGYAATDQGGNKYFVSAIGKLAPGSIEGEVRNSNTGRPVQGARVAVARTAKSATTDKSGWFMLEDVPAGEQVLNISAEGMQNTQVRDITVRPNGRHTLSAIAIPAKVPGVVQMEDYVVSAKKNEGVLELDPYAVEARREKPFTSNLDITRTINDAQPYYIFDAATIETSGATNVENFLKQRLTMIATDQTSSQNFTQPTGNSSSIDLRGLGIDKTLILVDGRRLSGYSTGASERQGDLNGIPIDAIERIEVLPSAASGIYGGSALGGVVNIITKRNYTGGEIRATYDNTFDTDSARRSVSLGYGLALEGGRTRVRLSASWSDSNEILLQDRLDIVQTNLATMMRNSPTYAASAYTVWAGALTNVTTRSAGLVLKDGTTPLNSTITYVPAGTSPSTSSTALAAGLLANAGQWNLDFPRDTSLLTGQLRSLLKSPQTRSMQVSLRREMLPWLEAYAEYSRNENESMSIYNLVTGNVSVPATAPTNPFTTAVIVPLGSGASRPELLSRTESDRFSAGLVVQLPASWTAAFDYTGSKARYRYSYVGLDSTARTADINSGALNPFVDQSLYPLDMSPYETPTTFNGRSETDDFIVKGAGELPALPWGRPSLAAGLERRIERSPESSTVSDYPITTANSFRLDYFPRRAVSDSAYAEVRVPLVESGRWLGVHALELQMSERVERYEVNTGTTSVRTLFNRTPVTTTYSGATENGQPTFSNARYSANDYTVGLKYQPVRTVTLRASRATAFLPPTMAQLAETLDPSTTPTSVTDPTTGAGASPLTISGGNPNVTPQNARSTNFGLIWEPSWAPLQGLRLNVEYYKIEQFDAISTLTPQAIVDMESIYPERVTRDSSGKITLVNISNLNLYKRDSEGWDFSASFMRRTDVGTFRLSAVTSVLSHLKTQYSLNAPAYDAVDFPAENGAVKYKSTATLNWDWQNWTAGWTVSHVGRYKVYGAPGGPGSTQNAGGGVYTYRVDALGTEWVASQIYHDAFVGYAFPRNRVGAETSGRFGGVTDGLTLQLGVHNIFNRIAPLDAFYNTVTLYTSPYGDTRLRTYWLSVKKAF